MAYFVPAATLLVCAALYVFENKTKLINRICGAVVIMLHICVIIYFLFIEAGMEIVLLFLTASLALAASAGAPKK